MTRLISAQDFPLEGVTRHSGGPYDPAQPERDWTAPDSAIGRNVHIPAMVEGKPVAKLIVIGPEHTVPNIRPELVRGPDWQPRPLTGHLLTILNGQSVLTPLDTPEVRKEYLTYQEADSIAREIAEDTGRRVTFRTFTRNGGARFELPSAEDGQLFELYIDGLRMHDFRYLRMEKYKMGVDVPGVWSYADGVLTWEPTTFPEPNERWGMPVVLPPSAIGLKYVEAAVGAYWAVEMPEPEDPYKFGPNDRANVDRILALTLMIAARLGVPTPGESQ